MIKTKSIIEFVKQSEKLLLANNLYFGHGTDNAFDEAVAMVEYVLNHRGLEKQAKNQILSQDQLKQLENIVNLRIKSKKPLAYITHQAFFANLPFFVDENVIIPRSPIAELILDGFSFMQQPIKKILDLCCGSGCIGLAIAYYFDIQVHLSDISQPALEIARKNKQLLENIISKKLKAKIVKSNLFQNIEGKFDLIITNPPYVSNKQYLHLSKEYHYEPKLALVAEDDGFDLIKKILHQAYYFLNDNGILIMEVGNNYQNLLNQYPNIDFIWCDFANGGDNVFMLNKQQLAQLSNKE